MKIPQKCSPSFSPLFAVMRIATLLFVAPLAAATGCSADGSSGSEDEQSSPHSVLVCKASSGGCECSSESRTTDPPSFECSTDALDGTTCCASSGYPGYGSCECKKGADRVRRKNSSEISMRYA